MWAAYASATGQDGPWTIGSFGDSPELIDALTALVLDGTKRATAGAVREYTAEGEDLPRVGDHWVVLDGSGRPACICRTEEARVGPLGSVDDPFAWDEGEGDRTRAAWLRDHLGYYQRVAADSGGDDEGEDLLVVFERFSVVWPPEHADPNGRIRDSRPTAFDPLDTILHLRPGTGISALPGGERFWSTLADRTHLHGGRIVTFAEATATWDHWERHPAGGELVVLLGGDADLIVETSDGEVVVPLVGRAGVIVPPGAWHRLEVRRSGTMVAVTAGEGTEHRPR